MLKILTYIAGCLLSAILSEFQHLINPLFSQDVMDMFFCGSGLTDKGTLCHLRNLLGFRNVTKDIGSSFNHVSEFLYLVTVGYTVLLAMEILQLKNMGDVPADAQNLDDVADTIVSKIWMDNNFNSVINPETDKGHYEYCLCAEGMYIFHICVNIISGGSKFQNT